MSVWVRADVHLGMPCACLVATDYELADLGLDLRKLFRDGPEAVEKVLCDLIGDVRPGWAGGCLVAVECRPWEREWHLFYVHRAFPKKGGGERAQRFPLLPGGHPLRRHPGFGEAREGCTCDCEYEHALGCPLSGRK